LAISRRYRRQFLRASHESSVSFAFSRVSRDSSNILIYWRIRVDETDNYVSAGVL
jgi:hypothetical protein